MVKLQSSIEHFQQISDQASLCSDLLCLTIQKACYHIEYTQSCTNIILAPVLSISSRQVRKNRLLVGFIIIGFIIAILLLEILA